MNSLSFKRVRLDSMLRQSSGRRLGQRGIVSPRLIWQKSLMKVVWASVGTWIHEEERGIEGRTASCSLSDLPTNAIILFSWTIFRWSSKCQRYLPQRSSFSKLRVLSYRVFRTARCCSVSCRSCLWRMASGQLVGSCPQALSSISLSIPNPPGFFIGSQFHGLLPILFSLAGLVVSLGCVLLVFFIQIPISCNRMKQKVRPEGSAWVQQMIKVTQWDNSHTAELGEFNLLTVHSLLIDSDPQFRQLKAVVENYNASIRDALRKKQPVNHASFRSRFTASLYKMLCEVTQMKNIETQKKCLGDVYRWARDYEFEKKERPVTATTMASRPNTAITRPASGVSTGVPARFRYGGMSSLQIEDFDKELKEPGYEQLFDGAKSRNSVGKNPPQEELFQGNKGILAQSQDFRQKSRTMHAELEAPDKRLKNYKRKCIDLEQETAPAAKKPPLAKPIVKPKEQPKLIIDIKAPDLSLEPGQQPPLAEGQQPPAEGTDQQVPPGGEQEDIPGIGGEDDIAIDGEGGEQEAEPEPEEEVKDKLAPRTKPYIQNYIPIENDALTAEQKRAYSLRGKVIAERREEQEMVDMGLVWARSKSRWEQEQNRRRESSKVDARKRVQSAKVYGQPATDVVDLSHPANLMLQHKEATNRLYGYEDTVNRAYLDQIKAANLDKIGFIHSKDHEVVPPAADPNSAKHLAGRALSAQITSKLAQPKRFTDILSAAQQKVRNQLDMELIEIKQRLAKNKVPCQFGRLQSALAYQKPSDPPDAFMFIAGKQLPSNPHFKVAKKKKKKKK